MSHGKNHENGSILLCRLKFELMDNLWNQQVGSWTQFVQYRNQMEWNDKFDRLKFICYFSFDDNVIIGKNDIG